MQTYRPPATTTEFRDQRPAKRLQPIVQYLKCNGRKETSFAGIAVERHVPAHRAKFERTRDEASGATNRSPVTFVNK
jgi:hypothetical protein